MKCIIVDDEALAIKVIQSHLEHLDGIEVVGTYRSGKEAFVALQQGGVDFVFLDIEMPGINGIQLLKTLKTKPKVIITTAYRDYAIEGYELEVTDYLLKPISFERLAAAVSKVMAQLQPTPTNYVAPSPTTEPAATKPMIYVKSDREHVRIFLEDILYIESLKNHIRIFLRSGEAIITLVAISKMMDSLPSDQFIRIHKTTIIALHHVERFTQSFVVIAGKTLPIGRAYKNEVVSKLEGYVV